MTESAALFLEETQRVAQDFPTISLRTSLVDTQVLWLTRKPEEFGVILASPLIGDILSDGFAGLVGGMGFVPCANLGSRCALFEPVHGSAPKYADRTPSIVNPIAAILAGAMLLDHIGEAPRAHRIRSAVAQVVQAGTVRTFDMEGSATTSQMTEAILFSL
jgi:3-isopropylmalate dehydrogenase